MNQHPLPLPTCLLAPDGFTQANGLPALPIVIGVVGHRDISPNDRETLKETLKAVFRQFQAAYRHTPLVVLSALAEGADQLAAWAALDAALSSARHCPFRPRSIA